MRVLVTGANGHVGCNLVRELLARDHEVVPFVRESANLEGLEPLGLRHAYGDVRDADAVLRAADGCDAIVHLAAVYAYGGTPEEIAEPALAGADSVLRAAAARGVQRVVYTSSIAAVGVADEATPLDEDAWNGDAVDPYMAAKTDSERRAWALADELGVPMVALNPAAIVGRHDYRITPSNNFIREYTRIPHTYHGGLNYVDVRDVAWVHAEALTRGEPGQRYLVASDNLTSKQVAAHVVSRAGGWPIHYALPRWAMRPMSSLLEGTCNLLGIEPLAQRGVVDEFYRRWCWYDNARARAAFDWTPRPSTDAIDESLLWLLHRDALRHRAAERVRAALGDPPEYDEQGWG